MQKSIDKVEAIVAWLSVHPFWAGYVAGWTVGVTTIVVAVIPYL